MHLMLYKKNTNRKITKRSASGSIIAENASVLYVLFFLIFFPLLDLSAMGLRTFFLWYSCNQAAMAGSKGTQWTTGNATGVSSGSDYYSSIQTQATNTFTSAVNMFSGISVTSGYPQLSVILTAIQHSDTANNQADASTVTLTGSQLPLTSNSTPPAVDTSQYVPILRVTVKGTIQPFMIIPWFMSVPGLNTSFPVTITSDQQIENATALNS